MSLRRSTFASTSAAGLGGPNTISVVSFNEKRLGDDNKNMRQIGK